MWKDDILYTRFYVVQVTSFSKSTRLTPTPVPMASSNIGSCPAPTHTYSTLTSAPGRSASPKTSSPRRLAAHDLSLSPLRSATVERHSWPPSPSWLSPPHVCRSPPGCSWPRPSRMPAHSKHLIRKRNQSINSNLLKGTVHWLVFTFRTRMRLGSGWIQLILL